MAEFRNMKSFILFMKIIPRGINITNSRPFILREFLAFSKLSRKCYIRKLFHNQITFRSVPHHTSLINVERESYKTEKHQVA